MNLTGVEDYIRKYNNSLLKFPYPLEKPTWGIFHIRPESDAGHGELPLKSLGEILIQAFSIGRG